MEGDILGQPQGRLSGTANRDHHQSTRGTEAAGGELSPGLAFRPAQASASSCTLGPRFGRQPGSAGSGARFEFPKKDFVWGFGKSDSPPYKPTSVLHIFSGLGQNRPPGPPAGRRGPGRPPSGWSPLRRPPWVGSGGAFPGRPLGPLPPAGHPPAFLASGCSSQAPGPPIRPSGPRRAEWRRAGARGAPGRRATAGPSWATVPESWPRLPGSGPTRPFSRAPADASRPAPPTASRRPLQPLVVRGGAVGGRKGEGFCFVWPGPETAG